MQPLHIAWTRLTMLKMLKAACLLCASWAKVAVPLTNMCRWFKVVMAVVRFLLAVSNCLMSRVISFTMVSLSPALFFISRI